MGHLRIVRNHMFRSGNNIRRIRATTNRRLLIKVLPCGKKIWRVVEVRVRNMCKIGVSQPKPIKHPEIIRQLAKSLRKRYSRRFLRQQ